MERRIDRLTTRPPEPIPPNPPRAEGVALTDPPRPNPPPPNPGRTIGAPT